MDVIFWLHSWWRWVVLIAAVAAIVKAFIGWFGRQKWQDLDDRLGLLYPVTFDMQFLLGLVVYIGSFTSAHIVRWYRLTDGSVSIMRLSMEHVLVMIIALVIVHVARSRARKAPEAIVKHRTTAIGFAISLILVIVSLPTWGMSVSL